MANFVVRTGDTLSTGHGCVGTTTLAGDNQDGTVHANGIDIAVIGAPTVSHPFPPDPPCAPHVSQLNAGSATVWINGIKVDVHRWQQVHLMYLLDLNNNGEKKRCWKC